MRNSLKKIRRSRERVFYGWHSREQARIGGEIIYEKVNGECVVVTEITDGPRPGGCWNDYKSKGFMAKYVDRFSHGIFGEMRPLMMVDGTPELDLIRRMQFHAMMVRHTPSLIIHLTNC